MAHPIVVVLAVAAVVRVVVAIVSFVASGAGFVPDERQYVALARLVASGKPADEYFPGYGQALYDSTWPFSAGLVLLFRLIDDARIVAQLYAAAFGVVTAALTVRIAREVVGRGWAIVAGLVVAVLPSQVLWSSIVLRESLIWAMLAGIAVAFATQHRPGRRSWALSWIGIVAMLYALGHLRSQTAVVAAWAVAIAAWFGPSRGRFARGAAGVLTACVLPMVVGLGPFGLALVRDAAPTLGRTRALLSLDADTGIASPTPREDLAVEDVCGPPTTSTTRSTLPGASAIAGARRRTMHTSSGDVEVICTTDGKVYVVGSGAQQDIAHIPDGLRTVLLEPFPWSDADNVSARLASFENLVWLPLYLAAAAGAVLTWRRHGVTAYPILVALGLTGVGALTQGNVGTAFRHRAQILWILAIFASATFERLARLRAEVRS